MIEQVNSIPNKHIQQYGLAEFLSEFQTLVQQGYELDLETNAHYPQAVGHLLTAVLVKPKQDSKVASTDQTAEDPQAKKPRKQKQD